MTMLAKARQNRVIAITLKAELAKRKAAAEQPVFRSRRQADNLDYAPIALRKSA